jgi:hypothetical protein
MEVLLKRLPNSMREAKHLRVNAEKDTLVATRITQKWRTPTNPIINARGDAPGKYDFLITAPFIDRINTKVADLIRMKIPFAALVPVSLLNEIDRKPDGTIDSEVQKARAVMQIIITSSIGQAWLINHPECRLPNKQHYVLLTTQTEDPEMVPLVRKQNEAWDKSLPSNERKRVLKISSKSIKNYHALLMSSFGSFMRDGVSMTKTPRELRAEKRSRDKGEWASPTSKSKRAKTKDKTLISPNLNFKQGTKNKNLASQNLAMDLANKK